jgi:hypothetical protein
MKELFLKLLGIKSTGAGGDIVHWDIVFTNANTPFRKLLLLLAGIAVGYGIWWFYRREPDYCALKRRRALALLRFLGALILLLIISGPVLQVVLQGYVKGKVVVLVDASQSMGRIDKYRNAEDKLVAAHVLGKVPLTDTDANRVSRDVEQDLEKASRIDLVRSLLAHPDIQLLEKLQDKYDVEMWSFSRAADMKRLGTDKLKLDASALEKLVADGVMTEIGGSLRATINRLKGQPLAGIVLLTDGGNNKGEEPAAAAQDLPVRVFPVGIGVPESHDIAVTYVFMESKIFIDDLAPIYVRINQHGFSGDQAHVVVSSEGEQLAQQSVTLRDSGEQTEIVRVKPKKAGKFTYKIEVKPPLNREAEDTEPSNNWKTREVEVIDQKISVLVIESEPRWEFRYLKNSLLRDKRVSCKVLLHVPDMHELAKNSTVYIDAFPTAAELFKYHAIIFGNMPNDGFFTEKDIENILRFVQDEGGGVWFIAGKNNFPDTFKDSKLEGLLPVEYERNPEVTAEDEQQNPMIDPVRMTLTPEGRSHSITRLDLGSSEGGDEKNAEAWGMMPPVFWFHKANRMKLNAIPLLVRSDEKRAGASHSEAIPLMVTSQVGRGRVLYQAFADLWRMRYPAELGPDALERFHGHVVQFLGLPKLLGRTARIEITVDREEYAVGDRAKIHARVLNKDMEYSTAEHYTALVTDLENEATQFGVDLTPEPGQRGTYRGDKVLEAAGKFTVTLKEESDEKAHADFSVVMPHIEMDNPDMKKEVLDNVAKSSIQGAAEGTKASMYFADQAGKLVDDLNESQRPVEERKENTLWDAPILLILFTLFMGAEWLVRKRSDLL